MSCSALDDRTYRAPLGMSSTSDAPCTRTVPIAPTTAMTANPTGTNPKTIRTVPATTPQPTTSSWTRERPNIQPVRSGGDSR